MERSGSWPYRLQSLWRSGARTWNRILHVTSIGPIERGIPKGLERAPPIGSPVVCEGESIRVAVDRIPVSMDTVSFVACQSRVNYHQGCLYRG